MVEAEPKRIGEITNLRQLRRSCDVSIDQMSSRLREFYPTIDEEILDEIEIEKRTTPDDLKEFSQHFIDTLGGIVRERIDAIESQPE
jgi:hypothetical protein